MENILIIFWRFIPFYPKNNQSTKIKSQKHLTNVLTKYLSQKNNSDVFIKKLNRTGSDILKKTKNEILKFI